MTRFFLELNLVETLSLAALLYFAGRGGLALFPFLQKRNIPAPVIGGLFFACLAAALQNGQWLRFRLDTALQSPLMIAFFTTIGLEASLDLLKRGGSQMIRLLLLSSLIAVLQNLLGLFLAGSLQLPPLVGLICGSITLMGGPATGAAFGQLLEQQHGVPGAVTLAMAAASFGILSAGFLGGPAATRLIQMRKLVPGEVDGSKGKEVPTAGPGPRESRPGEAGYEAMKAMALVLILMWAGSWFGSWTNRYFTLPAYVGAMLLAALFRNLNDRYLWLPYCPSTIRCLGSVSLSLFLSMVLMSMRLQDLAHLLLPMLVILFLQAAVMTLCAYWITFAWMGKDYCAAVMVAGHIGFGLGTTANAMANMDALAERFGAAPRAFLVLPIVGAFFIDFTNSLIITAFIHWSK